MAWGNGHYTDEPAQAGDLRAIRFKLIPFDEIQTQQTGRYLIKGLIPSEAMIVVWGPPKCGKSFWTFDVAMHIASDQTDYRGLKVKSGPVVYIAAEGAGGFLGRAQAWRDKHLSEESTGTPFYLLPMRLDMEADHEELIRNVRAQLPLGHMPALVVIDTLNRTFAGSESSDEDMTKYIKAADAVKAAFGCSVAIIHHCGHEATRPRGHTSLTGATDCQIKIIKDKETGTVTAEVEWMKDGAEGYKNYSKLEVVNIGEDEDGDEVTTCVIQAVEDDPEPVAKGQKMSPNERIAHKSLCAAVAEIGKIPAANSHIPAHVKSVSWDVWGDFFRRKFVAEKPDSKPGAPRMGFERSANSLIDKKRVGKWGDSFWIVGPSE